MKSFFLSISIFFCFLSCKTQEVKGINKYSTSSEVSAVTVDLPKSIQVPEIIKETIKETLPPIIIQKDSSKAIPNSVLISPTPIENPSSQTGTVSENTDSSVQNLDSSAFSWEVGIRATQILDVRTFAEYKKSHIYDAINMDVSDSTFINLIQTLDKTSPVAVYSRSGIRSLKAAKILQENGFLIIYNLNGGLIQWYKDGKELVR